MAIELSYEHKSEISEAIEDAAYLLVRDTSDLSNETVNFMRSLIQSTHMITLEGKVHCYAESSQQNYENILSYMRYYGISMNKNYYSYPEKLEKLHKRVSSILNFDKIIQEEKRNKVIQSFEDLVLPQPQIEHIQH